MTMSEGGSYYVIVRTLGGVVEGVGMNVAGSPSFKTGDKKIFMLKKSLSSRDLASSYDGAIFHVTGFSQGLCSVKKKGDEYVLSCGYRSKRNTHAEEHGVSKIKSSMTGQNKKTLKDLRLKIHERAKLRGNKR